MTAETMENTPQKRELLNGLAETAGYRSGDAPATTARRAYWSAHEHAAHNLLGITRTRKDGKLVITSAQRWKLFRALKSATANHTSTV